MVGVQLLVQRFFTALGVDFTPPKLVFFNDREGTLLVRNSLGDLDIIEAGVQALNIAPPQITRTGGTDPGSCRTTAASKVPPPRS